MVDYSTLTDAELARMTARAWTEAAKSWAEARKSSGGIKATLLMDAEAADAFWRDLTEEQNRRLADAAVDAAPVEDTSTSITYEPLPESPWVTRAKQNRLRGKDLSR